MSISATATLNDHMTSHGQGCRSILMRFPTKKLKYSQSSYIRDELFATPPEITTVPVFATRGQLRSVFMWSKK